MITRTSPARRDFGRLSIKTILASAAALLLAAAPAQAEVTRIKSNPNAIILDGVRIGDGMEYFFLSGQLPSPVDPAKSMADVKSLEDMGDSKAQTISTLNKIKSILEAQGYSMSDLVKLTLFVAADPRLGKMDFAGVNAGFREFFGTEENPNTVARSTFEVAGLVGPHFLIEIEAIAVRKIPEGTPEASYQRPHRLPPALRKKSLLAHHADGDSRGS
ncbi:MAG: RidA family protein [Alphaproteobacteria bacterium]|nr:RidA family protein [Alphaproteobacteria bacterium]MBU0793106.1 RidA family protein [Alphaproteobacteria bacterium]MBU0876904.1 RidA family protein [Alphaproteobacteria bacterium]MBU1771118.1 RidA family protein [Alphaproteobacteria bacterium]